MTTTTIKQQANQLLEQLQESKAKLATLEGMDNSDDSPSESSPQVLPNWLSFAIGLLIGAGMVALAFGLS